MLSVDDGYCLACWRDAVATHVSYRPQGLGKFGDKNSSVFAHAGFDLHSRIFDCADDQGASWHLGLAETWLRTRDGHTFYE